MGITVLNQLDYSALDENSLQLYQKFMLSNKKIDLNYSIDNQTPNKFICHSPARQYHLEKYSAPINATCLFKQLLTIKYQQRITTLSRLIDKLVLTLMLMMIAYMINSPKNITIYLAKK